MLLRKGDTIGNSIMSVSSWRQVVGELMECSQIFHVAIGYEISVSLLTYSSNNVFFMLAIWMYLDRVVKLARAIILYLRDLRLEIYVWRFTSG